MYKIFIKYNKRCFSTWDESLTICSWYCSFQGESWSPMFGRDRTQLGDISQEQGQDPLHPRFPKDPWDPCTQRRYKSSTWSFFVGATSSLGCAIHSTGESRIEPQCGSAKACQHVSRQAGDLLSEDVQANTTSLLFPCFWRQGGCAWGTALLGASPGELQSCTQPFVWAVALQTQAFRPFFLSISTD